MTTVGPFPSRTFGVLLHPSSLPGDELIGSLGAEAERFVDWLAAAGAGIWQVLPLTIVGDDGSPYFSPSTFAGNPWLVDLRGLRDQGLLDDADLATATIATGDAPVDIDTVRRRKGPILWAAADRFLAASDHRWRAGYEEFVRTSAWLRDACHFFALKDARGGVSWWEWEEPVRRRDPEALAASQAELAVEIERWQAVLWFFEVQWRAIRARAKAAGVRILGDLPIYVADDSADVWTHQDQFDLLPDGRVAVQAGVPPDYFSETGQLWGNPLYRWDVMAADGFAWWLSRLRRALEQSDIVRIDHFRALSAYWEVAADAEDAIGGRWVEGPGQAFLDAVRGAFPGMPVVAEDLGALDDDVYALRDDNHLPGMRVLQFGFDGTPDNPHHPANLVDTCIAYTGTHDNDTLAGWWQGLGDDVRRAIAGQLAVDPDGELGEVTWSIMRRLFDSAAAVAVVPVQDLLVLGSEARMNVPSTTEGNWSWRMPSGGMGDELAASLRALAGDTGRL